MTASVVQPLFPLWSYLHTYFASIASDIVEAGTFTLTCCILPGSIPFGSICRQILIVFFRYQLTGCQTHTVHSFDNDLGTPEKNLKNS